MLSRSAASFGVADLGVLASGVSPSDHSTV